MIEEFEHLRPDDRELMLNAPVLVAILIAGADGNIDKAERKEAISIARAKQSRSREQLVKYYKEVGERFEDKFNELINTLPKDTQARTDQIISELRKLNFIFAKIDKTFCIKLYASLKELAKRIAEASGGILGYMTVSYEESKLMELKMINDPSK